VSGSDREGDAPQSDVSDQLDAIVNKLQSSHAELDASMQERRVALDRIAQIHKDRAEANRRAEEGAGTERPGRQDAPEG
jgi:chromosome segregation ATPase